MWRLVPFLGLCAAVALVPGVAAAQQANGQHDAAQAGAGGAHGSGQEPGMMTEDQMHMDDQAARAHYRAGASLYAAGSFDRAAAEFEEAYHLSNRPALLYNAYIAYRDGSDVPHAVDALRRYLDQSPDAPNGVILRARLHSLERQQQQQQQEQAAHQQTQAQLQQSEAQRRAEEQRHQAEVRELQSRVNLRRIAAIVTAVGGAAVITGIITGVVANNKTKAIEAQCPGNQCNPAFDLADARDNARSWVRWTDILLFAGGAVAVGGFLWWLFTPSADAPAHVSASAACAPGGCGAVVRGTF